MAYKDRRALWFGTEEYSTFFKTPLRNADSSPQAWSEGGVLLTGGGYQFNSWGSHKTYQYEWGSASSFQDAQLMKSYYDGTYGRGLLYFYDCNIYQHNVLPAQWADPTIGLGNESSTLVYGVQPTRESGAATPTANQYPIYRAVYNLDSLAVGWRGREDAVYLPIPDGYTLTLGVAGVASGTGAVMYRKSNRGVLDTTDTPLTLLPSTGRVTNTWIESTSSVSGIWLFLGKTGSGSARLTLRGMTARLVKSDLVLGAISLGYGLDPYGEYPYGSYSAYADVMSAGPWSGGMGHSGVRFMSPPTFSTTGPLNGGQAGFAASFREVGSFTYA